MSDEESEHNEASQSEELDDEEDEENSPLHQAKNGQAKKGGKPINKKAGNKVNSQEQTSTVAATAASKREKTAADGSKVKQDSKQAKPAGPMIQPLNRAGESDSGSDNGSSGDSQPTGVSSGIAPGMGARMTFDGGAVSDDEANSWEDSLTESDGSAGRDDYYDEEDYDPESPSPKKRKGKGKGAAALVVEETKEPVVEEEEDEEDDSGPLFMNVHCTEYDIIKKVAKKVLGYKMREYPEDHDGAIRKGEHNQKLVKEWDVTWHDLSITPDFLAKLNPYQKVNHYPGIYAITRKNHLARNLMRMKRAFNEEFDFFPQTWVLPGDNIDFRNQFNKTTDKKQKRQTYIVKPDGLSQGQGIFMSRRMETILHGIETAKEEEGIGGWVVQHYLDNPHLVDDLKYDLRIYVLVNGVNPLRVYIHEEGLARFCTEPYKKPTARNMDNLFMHLTNYAINKLSDAYQQGEESSGDDESGHKRSLTAIMNILEACGADKDKLMREIKDIIVKTMATAQPYIAHLYRSCQPEDLDNSMCFQILGFDIMIDKKFKPWLIEVNQSPSFATDSPLDYKTKKAVLTDTFRMLNCSVSKRKKLLKKQKAQMESRILTGKQAKLDPEEKARVRAEMLRVRFAFEEKRKGQWELIYPWPEESRNEVYSGFIEKAQEIWDEFTTGKGKRVSMEDRRSQANSNAQNLNRQGTSKATINNLKGTLSNAGSSNNLVRTPINKNGPLKSGYSNKEIMSNSALSQINMKVQIPPHTSAGYPSQQVYSDRSHVGKGGQQPQISIRHLEVIKQASHEGGSPLITKMLNTEDSEERMPMATTPFKLSLQGGGIQYQQNQASVQDHLQRLTQPSTLNQPPVVSKVKQQQISLHKQANQILLQMDIQNPTHHAHHNSMPGQDPRHQSTESKMSAMKRQLETNARSSDQYDQLQQQHIQNNREMWGPNGGAANNQRQPDSKLSNIPVLENTGEMTPIRINKKDSQRIKRQEQKEQEVFTSAKQPSMLYRKSSRDVIGGHAQFAPAGSNVGKRSPAQQNNISTEGRQSLQMAGSEQMNFLIATNYSTAKINLEQYKQQVPSWVLKEGAAQQQPQQQASMDGQNRGYQNLQKENPQQLQNVPFGSQWKNSASDPQSTTLQQAKLMQQKQNEMTQQAYTNLKRGKDLLTPDLNTHQQKKAGVEHQSKSVPMTEQKMPPGHYQHVIAYDETLANRTVGSQAKNQHMPNNGRADLMESSSTNHRTQDSSDFHQAGQRLLLANTVGGFPIVSNQMGGNHPGLLKPPVKQAIKMTQMPIFLADNTGQHRLAVKKKETPKMKFKALPGIQGVAPQQPQDNMVKHSLKGGCKTLVKGSSTKLEGMNGSRFEPSSVQLNKQAGMKQKPNYAGIAANTGQGPTASGNEHEEQQYFQRRQAAQNEKNRQNRLIQGGLPVSHMPLKHAPNIKQLQMVSQNTASGPSAEACEQAYNLNHQNAAGPRRVEIANSAEGQQSSGNGGGNQQQTTTITSMSGVQQVSQVGAPQAAASNPTPSSSNVNTTAANGAQNGGGAAQVASSQLTPFQFYQHQQQQQKSAHMQYFGGHQPSTSPQQYQQHVIGGGQGAGGVSHQQQNQFILQKNNNFRQGLYQPSPQQHLMAAHSNQPQTELVNSHHAQHQQQPHTNPTTSTVAAAVPPNQQQLTNQVGKGTGGFNHQQRILSNQPQANQQVRTSSSKGNLGGSGANNRRMGRALGQGKSMGVAQGSGSVKQQAVRGGQVAQNLSSQQVYGVGGASKIYQPQQQRGFVVGNTKASVGVISSTNVDRQPQLKSGHQTQNSWQRQGTNSGGPSEQLISYTGVAMHSGATHPSSNTTATIPTPHRRKVVNQNSRHDLGSKSASQKSQQRRPEGGQQRLMLANNQQQMASPIIISGTGGSLKPNMLKQQQNHSHNGRRINGATEYTDV